MGILVILMAGFLGSMSFPDSPPKEDRDQGRQRKRLLTPILAVFTAMLLLYVSAEIGASNWIAELFVREIEVSASFGALMVSLMWLGVFAGRMGLAIWFRGTRQAAAIMAISVLSASSFAALLVAGTPAAAALCVFGAGLGLSGVYPMVITLVGRHCPGGAAVGIVSTGGGIGSFAFPFLIGFVGDRAGLRGGFGLCIGACAALAVLAWVVTRYSRSPTAARSSPRE